MVFLVCSSLGNKQNPLSKEDVVVYLLEVRRVMVLALLPSKQQTCCCSVICVIHKLFVLASSCVWFFFLPAILFQAILNVKVQDLTYICLV